MSWKNWKREEKNSISLFNNPKKLGIRKSGSYHTFMFLKNWK